MYSNVFDTVRTSEPDLINYEGLLYSSILSGLHPTFSLNQAIDSTALINIVGKNDIFLDFFRDRRVRVALFGKYTGEKDAIMLFLTDKLTECIDSNKASFRFSSLPFLYTEEYTQPQRVKIYRVMRDIISGDRNSFSSYLAKEAGINPGSDHADNIENYLLTIKKIVDSINGHYVLPANKPNNATLYKKVIKNLDILFAEVNDSDLRVCSKDFKILLEKQKKQGYAEQTLSSRSNMYNLIQQLKCSEKNENELKSIVDLCYNEIVAASIADNEDDIMVTNNYYEYAQVYANIDNDNNLDKVEQKLSIVRHSKNNGRNSLSWELLSQILSEARPDKNDLEKWYCDMEKYCRQLGLESARLGGRQLFIGLMYFGITALSNALVVKLLQTPHFNDSFGSQVAAGTAEDIIKNVAVRIISYPILMNKLKQEDIRKQIKKNQVKQDVVKQLISQVSLLKKDYGNRP